MSDGEMHLGVLAVKFRSTRDPAQRQAIAKDYAKTVKNVIYRGGWNEMPAPEDQLPDDYMPREYSEFWSCG
jgi:hypothetical protein